jgi:KUP system potassium uptake protein
MANQHAVAPAHADSPAPEASLPESHLKAGFWTLTLGAIGVVYGDIGTSPLYAMRETVMAATGGHHGTPVPLTRDLVIAILSLLIWALILTVTVKYVILLLRADNKGEGGSLTLVALAQRALG